MPVIKSHFRPAWWLRGAHAQTIWSKVFHRNLGLTFESQRVELPDGDFIDLAWSGPIEGKTVLLLHGLEGNINSDYIGRLVHELNLRGYRACIMHFRGCSHEPNRLPEWYHSGKSDDPQLIVEFLRKEMDIEVYAAVGVSLGGNVLRSLVGAMKQSYREKFATVSSPLDINIDAIKTFWEFDDQVTAPLHGFKGADDFYVFAHTASGRRVARKCLVGANRTWRPCRFY